LSLCLGGFSLNDMHISWHGEFTVKIVAGDKELLIDPHAPATGLRAVRSQANVVALSNPSDPKMSYLDNLEDEPTVFDTPGEYDMSGFGLYAMNWRPAEGEPERSVQRWTIEDVVLLHVGALNRDLSDKELQALEKVAIDVLLVPVGAGEALNSKQAVNLVTTIEPRMVIPIHYAVPELKEKLEGIEQFAKEMGIDPSERHEKVIVKANKLPQEDVQTVLLTP
jgi:L-ascorbate metabolism protein UlaG (beta-lactamase superfamily)